MITLSDIQKTNVQNASVNNSSNINNSISLIISPEKVELQPGLIALVSLMALILLIMTAVLLLPKSIQDNVFQLVLHQAPDQTFNYIDVGLYKTRHSIYRKEVYSLAMQGNQSRKKFETHPLLGNNSSINSKSKYDQQSKKITTKSIVSSVSVLEDTVKSNKHSFQGLTNKSLLPLHKCHPRNQDSQLKNTKSVVFTDYHFCNDNGCNNETNCNNNNSKMCGRRNSTSDITNNICIYTAMKKSTSLPHVRHSQPLCFIQSNQDTNSGKLFSSREISPESKQFFLLNKRVRLQLSDNMINRFK
ncbi:hypothetical protein MN116_001996 [Schistosoma mekongi]|uniref:Uncharacterized protein n=1 Tax=Schistosoma mekongi TaxID=38744 RepID=A0AAE1ZIX0_SCHME|nr:hypothetical protein MN116_001996 [Schistosoma mekongi]